MDRIRVITIIVNDMAIAYCLGQGLEGDKQRVIASIERFPGYEDVAGACFSGNFILKDKDGKILIEISAAIPYVITYV